MSFDNDFDAKHAAGIGYAKEEASESGDREGDSVPRGQGETHRQKCACLWHLDEVLAWLKGNGEITPDREYRADNLIALCETIRAFNATPRAAPAAAQAVKLMES